MLKEPQSPEPPFNSTLWTLFQITPSSLPSTEPAIFALGLVIVAIDFMRWGARHKLLVLYRDNCIRVL